MHPRTLAMQTAWHATALHHLLLKHNIQLDERRTQQHLYLQKTINRLPTTVFDHLEVLRLFHLALSHREPIIVRIGKHRKHLATLDLFYCSMIVGLKMYAEAPQGFIDLIDILLELEDESVFQGEIKSAINLMTSLESAFLKGIGWRFHGSPQQALEHYRMLLRPLNQKSLNRFSAGHLYTASTGAGDHQSIHEVLCELNPGLREKSAPVMQCLSALPLKVAFVEDNSTKSFIEDDIFDFLTSEQTDFNLSEKSMNIIRCTLSEYFRIKTKPIKISQLEDLKHYFTTVQIERIKTRNIISRLEALEPKKKKSDACTQLIQDLLANEVNLAWLMPILTSLEALHKKAPLHPWVLITVFTNHKKSAFILHHILRLSQEGWLEAINKRKELKQLVAGLIFHHYLAANLMPDIKNIIEAHFIKTNPGLYSIKQLIQPNQSELGKQLTDGLLSHYYKGIKNKLVKKIVTASAYDAHTFTKLELYLEKFPDQRLACLEALTIIKEDLLYQKTSPLLIALLAMPERLRFGARLAYLLKNTFDIYELNKIPEQMPTIYSRILKSVYNDPVALHGINEFFKINNGDYKDSIYTLNSIDAVKPHIRSVIDAAIAKGRIRLDSVEIADLHAFYKSYDMAGPLPPANNLPICHFFAPKIISGDPSEESNDCASRVLSV